MSRPQSTLTIIESSLVKRYRAERRFIWYGRLAILVGILALAGLFISIIGTGYQAFIKTEIQLDIDPSPDQSSYDRLFKTSLYNSYPDIKKRGDKKLLRQLFSSAAAFEIETYFNHRPTSDAMVSLWLTADDKVDSFVKNDFDASAITLQPKAMELIKLMHQQGKIRKTFNSIFFTSGDSREPEQAGIWGSMVGSLLTLFVTLLLSFPIGVAAAIYLEEFAVKNRITSTIEVNINNLAAVPSIIVGLLGLAVFINFFGLPRSTPLVGGLVLTLMTLPTIIIASRAALQSIPPSIKEAALGIGASPTQVVFHHLFPIALPGMLTGSIIGMARALGETAPLLMIGMVAFIVDIPTALNDTATVLPVQIYLWADSPERAFVEKTSAAIIVLLSFLITMNSAAVYLRKKLETRW